ncbi:MAG TPA: SDR family oxidoreductase [Terriglobales bacterium]|nr:SDR family oxidoreductase [Terriglobales bacterium]
MRILVLGAGGFIGRQVVARLLSRGYRVIAGLRATDQHRIEAAALRLPPTVAAVVADIGKLQQPEQWQEILRNVDAVVNCAGILQSDRRQSAKAVHETGPIALFDACRRFGPSIVVHVSAISADAEAGTEYAQTRIAAERHLCASLLDWSLLRPSLVYGPGSGGGTSAIRGLAGFPFVTPLPGNGKQLFAPIHGEDLAECICRVLETRNLRRQVLSPAGPENLTLREIVSKTRRWLGFTRRPFLRIPLFLIRPLAWLGDWIGAGPIRSTSLQQMAYGNEGNGAEFAAAIGFAPRSMDQALQLAPAYVQDRWHARLWFLRPALTVTLALMWLGSGLLGLINPPLQILAALGSFGLPGWLAATVAYITSLIDLVMGGLIIAGRGDRWLAFWQIVIVVAYTIALTIVAPALWADPLGPLLKNLPILAAIAAWAALLERD